MTTLDYQTRADRHNKRTAKRFPLFAAGGVLHEVVKPWTADSLAEIAEEHECRTREYRRAAYAHGAELRDLCVAMLPPDEMHALDRRFARAYPHKGEYFADFWWRQFRRIARANEAQR